MVLVVADPDSGIEVVGIDDRRGAFVAASHLLSLGHRSVAFIDAARPLGNREKYEGYEAALKTKGIAVDPRLVVNPHGHAATDGYRAMQELAIRGPLPGSLFASNDSLAIGALGCCRANGVRVP